MVNNGGRRAVTEAEIIEFRHAPMTRSGFTPIRYAPNTAAGRDSSQRLDDVLHRNGLAVKSVLADSESIGSPEWNSSSG